MPTKIEMKGKPKVLPFKTLTPFPFTPLGLAASETPCPPPRTLSYEEFLWNYKFLY
jgi:hypothetical protein